MPFALFPALADRYGGTQVVGLLWAAPGVGALVSMATSGWAARVHHNGRAIVLAAAAWGVVDRALRPEPRRSGSRSLLLALGGRRGRHLRHLPRRAVERDDPGRDARAPRGRGDDLVVVRSAARQRRARARAPSLFGLRGVGLRRRRARRRRLGRARARAAALLELRLESGELSRGAVDHRGPLAEREAQVAARARPGGWRRPRSGSRRRRRGGAARARTRSRRGRRRRWRSTCPAARAPPGPASRSPAHRWSRLVCSSSANAAYQSSSRRSAAAPAYWNGVAPAKVMNCLAARTPATSDAGPVAQPTFQPVTLNVLPSEEIVSVRSAMPGQRGQRDVLEPVEDEVLVDLVGDRDQVVLHARRRRSSAARRG